MILLRSTVTLWRCAAEVISYFVIFAFKFYEFAAVVLKSVKLLTFYINNVNDI